MSYQVEEPPVTAENIPEYLSRELRRIQIALQQEKMFTNGCIWTSGRGTPNGVVAAPVGSLYTDIAGGAGTTLYVKESGTSNTGWVAK